MAEPNCKAPMTRAEYRESVRCGAAGNFTCEHCGIPAYRKPSGTNSGPNRFCSMACRRGAALVVRIIKAEQAARIAALRNVGKAISRLARQRDPRPGWVSTMPAFKVCLCCGQSYKPVSTGGMPSSYCCDECRRRVKRAQAKAEKIRRKKLLRNATVEAVDPIRVFERDRWVCCLCGVKTPRAKRGSIEDNAPELDHIIPLACGGDHSYLNTQCACRLCNRVKSDQPRGQLLLIG